MYEEKFKNLYRKLELKKSMLGQIKGNLELISQDNFTDTELRLYLRNWYFRYHKSDVGWPATNFENFPEFKEDKVFSKLINIYERMRKHEDKVHLDKTEERQGVEDLRRKSGQFATDMANRKMKEKDYLLLLSGKHELFKKDKALTKKYNIKKTYCKKVKNF